MGQNFIDSSTIQSSPAGNIEFTTNEAGSQVNLTHSSGANTSFNDRGISTFSPENSQTLTLKDDFSTVYGSRNAYTQGTLDNRIEGDSVDFVGPSTLVHQNLMEQWFNIYADGIGAIQAQWPDNRFELNDSDFPVNPMFIAPKGIGAVTVCPELKNGTLENNKDETSKNNFESSMMGNEAYETSDATKALRNKLDSQYSDFTLNVQNLNNSLYKKN